MGGRGRGLALSSKVCGGRDREGELGGGSLGGVGRNGLAASTQLLELAATVKGGEKRRDNVATIHAILLSKGAVEGRNLKVPRASLSQSKGSDYRHSCRRSRGWGMGSRKRIS